MESNLLNCSAEALKKKFGLSIQWIKDLNVRPETIKLLEENIGRTLGDISQRNILYDPPPRVMEIKTKVNKWALIKLKSFCIAKETIFPKNFSISSTLSILVKYNCLQ